VELVAAVVMVAGETAKMRPSKQGAAGTGAGAVMCC
jgi:hypothetical protein